MSDAPEIKVSERVVQDALFRFLRASNVWPILPNVDCITGYECDLLAVTKAGFAHEYEIKVSLADFRADRRKVHKHASLAGRTKQIRHPYYLPPPAHSRYPETMHVLQDADESDAVLAWRGRCYPERRPKRFWYVVHGFTVPLAEVPEYAGLMTYHPDRHACQAFSVERQAPDLPSQKVLDKYLIHATNNMLYRYWNNRTAGGAE